MYADIVEDVINFGLHYGWDGVALMISLINPGGLAGLLCDCRARLIIFPARLDKCWRPL